MTTSPPPTLAEGEHLTGARLRRAVGAATIGNALEWFDWTSYSAFAAIFGKQIFGGDGDTALLNTFAVFAVGFVMRPLGGALIGAFADRRGRRAALTLCISLMALGALIIGSTPGYHQIGGWAAVILVLARLIQGVSVGGDYGASPIFLSEIAAPSRRGLVSSLHYVSLTFGLLAASGLGWLLSAMLTTEQLEGWGWRVPFLCGALAALWGLYLRRTVAEPGMFVAAKRAERQAAPPAESRSAMVSSILRVIGMTGLGSITFWTLTSYLPSHAQQLRIPAGQVFAASTCALLIFLVLQPVAGWSSDRIGRKPLLIGYAAGMAVLAYPLLVGIQLTSGLVLFGVMVTGLVVFACYSAISATFLAEQFPTRRRSTGVGIAHNVASALFGGTAPYLLVLLTQTGHVGWFAGYVVVAAVVSAALFARIPEMSGKALPR
jgi:MHS family alpha-ketoglutarate permease-like MFS transporter